MIVPEVEKLLEACDYALEVLDNYADIDDGDDGLPTPNRAMIAGMLLQQAVDAFRKHHTSPDDGRTL